MDSYGAILSGGSSLNWFLSQIVSGEGSKELNSYRLIPIGKGSDGDTLL